MDKKAETIIESLPSKPKSWYPLSFYERWGFVIFGLFLSCGFAVAVYLEPSSRGFGTHQQLGLPPCTFRYLFQFPCPSCGMTTSFSHFVRGNWIASAQANWAGLALALSCTVLLPWTFLSAWKGRTLFVHDLWNTYFWVLMLLCGLSAMRWLTVYLLS